MTKRYEGFFLGHDQTELFYQNWLSAEPRGTIVITHGQAEHSECYHEFATELSLDHWDVYAWDLRGHGRSEGKRGYVAHFEDYEKDLASFIEFISLGPQEIKKPLVLLGHSMGGLITLLALIKQPDEFPVAGLALSCPALGLAVQVPKLKQKAAELSAKWAPRITLYNEILMRDLIRDHATVKSYESDPLRHDKISPMVYLGMVEGFDFVANNAEKVQRPLLLQLAGNDRIVSTAASQKVFEKFGAKNKELVIYPESYHEIYKDLDKEVAIKDLKKFLNEL